MTLWLTLNWVNDIKIFRSCNLIISTPERCGIYFLEAKLLLGLNVAILNENFTLAKLWHKRLGHITKKSLKFLQNKGVFWNLNFVVVGSCEQCIIKNKLRYLEFINLNIYLNTCILICTVLLLWILILVTNVIFRSLMIFQENFGYFY